MFALMIFKVCARKLASLMYRGPKPPKSAFHVTRHQQQNRTFGSYLSSSSRFSAHVQK